MLETVPLQRLSRLALARHRLPVALLAGALLVVGVVGPALAQPTEHLMHRRRVDKPVLSFRGQRQVSLEEFQQVYRKHQASTGAGTSPEEVHAYLNLYIDFCRKVMEAERLGLDTTAEYRAEYNAYVRQLSQSFLVERQLVDRLVDEAVVRSLYQIHASHLLVALPHGAYPDDTLSAYRRVMAYRDSILSGRRPFGDWVARYSDEPQAAITRGDLGYFSVFEMVYPFESAAYLAPVGRVTMPIRTEYGYHLLLVHDRMPNQHGRRVAHILVRPQGDSIRAFQRMEAIRNRLAQGQAFSDLAREFSDDRQSAPFGGLLDDRRLAPELERIRGRLSPGEVSAPVTTRDGFHLLMLVDEMPPVNEATRRALYRTRIIRDDRVKVAEAAMVERLKFRYQYQDNSRTVRELARQLGYRYFTLRPGQLGSLDKRLRRLPVFRFADRTVRVNELLAFRAAMASPQAIPNQPLEDIIRRDVARLARQRILDYEKELLPKHSLEFRALAREYHDGLLLFTLMEHKVWRRAAEDSVGLRAFFEAHKTEFVGQPQIRMVRISSTDSLTLRTYAAEFRYRYALAEAGQPAAEPPREAPVNADMQLARAGEAAPNASSILPPSAVQSLQMFERTVPASVLDSADATRLLMAGPGHCEPMEFRGGTYHCECVRAVLPAAPVSFQSLRGELLRLYQQHLERQWLDQLAKRYPVRIHEKNLGRIAQP